MNWSLLRTLMPTWRFFEEVGVLVALEFRSAEASSNFTDWKTIPKPHRHLRQLVHNPEGTMSLAIQNLLNLTLERLADFNGSEERQFEASTPMQLLSNLVEFELNRNKIQYHRYQFRIITFNPLQTPIQTEIALVSSEYGRRDPR